MTWLSNEQREAMTEPESETIEQAMQRHGYEQIGERLWASKELHS